jgi:hypothetical protein
VVKQEKTRMAKGHTEITYGLVTSPNEIIELIPEEVKKAKGDWKQIAVNKRQVIDIVTSKKVRQYEQYVYRNINTGQKVYVDFLEGVNVPMNYGEKLKAFVVYLREENFITCQRLSLLFKEVRDIRISELA